MKRVLALLSFALLFAASYVQAQNADDQYVRVYNLIQQADDLNNRNQATAALPKYLEAQSTLARLQKQYPDWNPKVVNFRLNYLNAKIAAISPKLPAVAPAQPTPTVNVPNATPAGPTSTPIVTPTAPAPTTAKNSSAELEQQTASLQEEVRRLQTDKTILESKLKEALATQPASVDPRELTKAAERIKNLLKENDTLKASLEQEKNKPPTGPDPKAFEETKLALAEANKKLAQQGELAKGWDVERQALQSKISSLSAAAPDTAMLDATKKSLEEANRKLASQATETSRLTTENASLQSRLKNMMASVEASEALKAENQLLKKQLAEATSGGSGGSSGSKQLAAAQAQIAALQSDAEILRLEKIALQNRIRQMNAPAVATTILPTAGNAQDAERIKKLEQERDDLQKKLEAANKEIYGKNSKEVAAKIENLTTEISTLRARLNVLEARSIPYTPEELALFKQDDFSLGFTGPNTGKKPISDLPGGSQKLVEDAERYFKAGEFQKAEAAYLEILKRDDKNANTLANLATIQFKMNHLDDAEKHIKQALAVAPEDGYSLYILGTIKYNREQYDEALDALSRAAKVNPQNAELQNYLGLTLSHKGMRGPAETALRKAIQIEPGYAAAHNNLAVIYLTQKPPLLELARWHYQKARNGGIPANAELEKMLDKKTVANGGQ